MPNRAGTPAASRRCTISPYTPESRGGERHDRAARRALRAAAVAAALAALALAGGGGVALAAAAAPRTPRVASPDAPSDPIAPPAPAASPAAAAAAAPRLSRGEVPATGHQEAIVAIAAFGRYSVRAASAQGSAVRVIDRMAGELGAAGEAGRENGRLDLFLDRGEYKVVVDSHEHGEGTAKLSVASFVDVHPAAGPGGAPELVERKLLGGELDDLRQASYWLRLPARRAVRLEAAGRNLADLRLWRDGSWLEDVTPDCAPIQPVVGKPLLRCEVAAVMPAGLYLVTAYGGAGQTWSEGGAEHPFHLRWGYPELPDAGRRRYVVSAFGEDWFALPDNVNYVRIELPEAASAHLDAGWAAATERLTALAAPDTAEVSKKSVPPVAELHVTARPEGDAAAGDAGAAANAGHGAGRNAEPSIAEPRAAAPKPAAGAEAEGDDSDTAANAGASDNANDAIDTANAAANAAGGAGDEGAAGEAESTPATGASPEGADVGGAGAPGAADQAMSGGGENGAAEEPAAAEAPNGGNGNGDANGEANGEANGAAGNGEANGTADAGEAATGGEAEPNAAGGADQAAASTAKDSLATVRRLWVAVRGVPGQVYVLQHFEQRDEYSFRNAGPYWISTVHSGDPRDSVDATAVLTSTGTGSDDRDRLDASAAIAIDGTHAWARRFNLLQRLTLYLSIGDKGRYEVVSAGGGQFRVEPFATSRPKGYKAPAFGRSGAHFDLDPGIYVLTAQPQGKAGIVTVGVRPAGKFPSLLADAAAPGGGPWPVRASVRLAPQPLDPERRYTLRPNNQPGVEAGVVFRPWPVNLDQPLPVTQRPGEPLAVDFTTEVVGTLRAEAEDGQLLEASVDHGPWQTAPAVAPAGRHHVEVRNPAPAPGEPGSGRTVSYSLWVEPAALAAAAPLPPLPAGALAALPAFPVLRPGAPHRLDLDREASTTLSVQADKPGLYELQTTGVLATAATLRTRTVVALARASANGVGRNALVRQYLHQGDVQATISTVGLSRGHLGIELTATELIDGGELRGDAPARLSLPAGQAVVYRFTIEQPGDYRLLAMGLGFVYECRIEDADGWPVAPPNLRADLTRHFDAGHYRLILLPQPLASRAVTRLEAPPPPLHFTGHGPHTLPLDRTVEHLWREPAAPAAAAPATPADANAATAANANAATGATTAAAAENEPVRPPDRWRFTLPAAATTTVALDAEMAGSLTRVDPPAAAAAAAAPPAAVDTTAGAVLGQVPPGRSLTIALGAGTYEVAVTGSRRNDLVRYHLRVHTAELVDGEERLLQAPIELPVASAGGGLEEIASYSASDVRARLYAADGALVADADDRPDDWNFLISERLPAGRYRLAIEPVGRSRAQLRVSMRNVAEVEDPPLALPFSGDVAAGSQVHLLPLPIPGKADLLLLAARSDDNLGLTLERREAGAWRTVGSATGHDPRLELALPATAGAAPEYRARLWSLDRRGNRIQLGAAAVSVPHAGEGRLAKGIELAPLAGLRPPLAPLAAVVVETRAPGLLRLRLESGGKAAAAADAGPGAATWRDGGIAGQVLEPALATLGAGETVAALDAQGGRVWVAAAAPHGALRLRGERLPVPAGLDHGIALPLPAADAVVEAGIAGRDGGKPSGPLLVMAAAHTGQPAVAVAERGTPWTPGAATAGMSLGDRSAVAVALAPHEPVLRAWNGARLDAAGPDPEGAASELRLSQQSFAAPAAESAAWGVGGASLSGLAARRYDLPPGQKEVRLSLGGGLVGVLSTGDTVTSVHWQGGQPFEELLATDATRLTLLHTRDGADPFTFELLPRPGAGSAGAGTAAVSAADTGDDLALPAGAPFTRTFDRAGTLRLRLPLAAGNANAAGAPATGNSTGAPAAARYRVWSGTGLPGEPAGVGLALLDAAGGAHQAASAANQTARSTAGAEIGGAAGGVLLVRHGPGTVVVWQAPPATAAGGAAAAAATGALWQAPLAAPAQSVVPPATAPLTGRFAHLALDLRQPAVLHLRSAAPALTLLRRAGDDPAGAAEAVAVHPAGVRLDAYLPAGVSHVGLAALGSGVLAGSVEVTTTPVAAIGEGKGAEVLLPAGDTRYFSFHVDSRRPIGWGVAAGAERVTCRLLRGDGTPLAAPAASTSDTSSAARPRRAAAAGSAGAGDVAAAPAPRSSDLVDVAELDAGDYLLALSAPADAAPVRARPVVVGLALPDTGPPAEVIRQYLQEAGAVAPTAASGSHP